MKINMKRVYEKSSPQDGYRVLVDRLWPRGISKEEADLNEWNKSLAPSNQLRKWFHHDPELWDSFQIKYLEELKLANPSKEFLERVFQQEIVTLIYAAKDEKHCHPLVLKSYLEELLLTVPEFRK